MGNAVGPVTLIAGGIYLGYLTLTGRAANFVAFVKSGGTSLSSSSAGSSSSSSSGSSPAAADPSASATPLADASLAKITNPWGIIPWATAQQAAAALQLPLIIDPGFTSGN